MKFRDATIKDIDAMHTIRMSVKENILNNPALVTRADYEKYIEIYGRGWVCEINDQLVGFVIIDNSRENVWALFIHPEHEQKGIGKQLQSIMLNWYFSHYDHPVWLSTSPATRAEKFYELTGWKKTGITSQGETRFEISKEAWKELKS